VAASRTRDLVAGLANGLRTLEAFSHQNRMTAADMARPASLAPQRDAICSR